VGDDVGLDASDVTTLRRVIPYGCIAQHLDAQVVLSIDDKSDMMPTVPLKWPHTGPATVDVDWLRSQQYVLTADVTELVAFALLTDSEEGAASSEDFVCSQKIAEAAHHRLLQGEVVLQGGPDDAMKLYKKYSRHAAKQAAPLALPPVCILTLSCFYTTVVIIVQQCTRTQTHVNAFTVTIIFAGAT